MQKITKQGLILVLLFTISFSCKNGNDALAKKKAELEKLKTDKESLDTKITALQKDIDKLDTSAALEQKPKLVSLTTLQAAPFKHYLELQGTVDNRNVSFITPTGQGGQIKAIYVKQGDHVKQGQLILRLDNTVALQNVEAVKQQLGGVKAQLDLAKSLYERQKNLWDQHIGTEVQLLQDKTNVEALQNQLNTIQAQVNVSQAQANQSNVYSDVNGIVNTVTAHVGDFFGGGSVGASIEIVNDADLKITVNVPENYASQVNKGTAVEVDITDINKTFNSTISFLSQAIGINSRGFNAEIKVPSDISLRPNEIAIVKILDYTDSSTIAINVNTLQNDEQGKFVLVAAKEGNNMVARKRKVTVGKLSGDKIQITSGLQVGDQLITDGYQSLYDGQLITTTAV
jgi:membrane fusion protein (multidrug efflux system)